MIPENPEEGDERQARLARLAARDARREGEDDVTWKARILAEQAARPRPKSFGFSLPDEEEIRFDAQVAAAQETLLFWVEFVTALSDEDPSITQWIGREMAEDEREEFNTMIWEATEKFARKSTTDPQQKRMVEHARILVEFKRREIGRLQKTKVRTGKRLNVQPSDTLRIPTPEPIKDALMILGRGRFKRVANDPSAIWAEHNGTQVRITCDDSIGFGAERMIQVLAQYGASVTQTFLAMAGLWMQQKRGDEKASYDSYLEAGASDLLRYMGRVQTSGGGYNNEDLMARGRDVYIIMNASVPKATRKTTIRGKRSTTEFSLSRLAVVETIFGQFSIKEEDGELSTDDAEQDCILRFKYHLGRAMYEFLCGDAPQFAEVSGKLLGYHPWNQRYHILLGFGLAFFDRVNREVNKSGQRKIGLPALLNLAALEIPARNLPTFLERIERALNSLNEDKVIPGVVLRKPSPAEQTALSTRKIISLCSIEFPPLLQKGGEPASATLPA